MRTERLAAGDIGRAAELLRAGRLVAFPTETVYGLGADATSEAAVLGIYTAKGRPSTNPLIVHVPDADEARRYAATWPAEAERLADVFWPGPLTLVLPVAHGIAAPVLAGGDTVGLRVPAHPVAAELLRACRLPLAAPSANRSNSLSPTSAEAVLDTLDGRIAAVLDGGHCEVGIESTVVDLAGGGCRVLRPGRISAADLSEVLGRPVASAAHGHAGPIRSPGQFPRHYAPAIPMSLGSVPEQLVPGQFVIRFGAQVQWEEREAILPSDPEGCARYLYLTLRAAEKSGASSILMQNPPSGPGWEAVLDRVRRATQPA